MYRKARFLSLSWSRWLRVVLLCTCITMIGCSRHPYPILESGYVMVWPYDQVYWLDNDRVIFTGMLFEKDRPLLDKYLSIHVWNTTTGVVETFKQGGRAVCYRNGNLHYEIPLANKAVIEGDGTWGNMREQRFEHKSRDLGHFKKNALTCQRYDVRKLPGYDDEIWRMPLRKGDGYLEAGMKNLQDSDRPLRWLPAEGGSAISLGLREWQIQELRTHYSEFAGVYVLWGNKPQERGPHTNWPKDLPRPIYLWKPRSAQVHTVSFPYDDWLRPTSPDFFPVKPGYFINSPNFGRGVSKPGGGILFSNNQYVKLIGEQLAGVDVSPDGCKVAFGHFPLPPAANPKMLKMIDLCQGK